MPNDASSVPMTGGRGETVVAGVSARRYVLGLLALIYMLNCIDRQIMAVVTEPMKRELGISDTVLGLVNGIGFAATFALIGIPLARLADRAPRKPIIAAATLIFSCFTAGCGLVASTGQLALMRLGVAVGEAGTNPQSHSIIADLFPSQTRPMAMAVFGTGANVGLIIAFFGGGMVTTHFGWRAAFLVPGLLGLLVCAIFWLTMREPDRSLESRPLAQKVGLTKAAAILFQNKALLHLTIGLTLATLSAYAGILWLPAFFMRTYGLTAADAGILLAVIVGGGGLVGTLSGGALSAWLGRKDARWSLWIVAAGQIVAAPMVLAAYGIRDLHWSLIFIAGPALTNTFGLGPSLAHLQGLSPVRLRATASALVGLVTVLVGAGLGPTLVGAASDGFARLGVENSLAAALAASALIWVWAAIHYFIAGTLLERGQHRDAPAARIQT